MNKAAKIGETMERLKKDDAKACGKLQAATMKSFDAGYKLGVEKGWIPAPKVKESTTKKQKSESTLMVGDQNPVTPPLPDSTKAHAVEVPLDDEDATPPLYELAVEAADDLLTHIKALIAQN